MTEESQKQLNFNVDPEIGKGRYADTVNIHVAQDMVCLTFAAREPLSGDPGVNNAVARVYIPFGLAKTISEQLLKAEQEKKEIPVEE